MSQAYTLLYTPFATAPLGLTTEDITLRNTTLWALLDRLQILNDKKFVLLCIFWEVPYWLTWAMKHETGPTDNLATGTSRSWAVDGLPRYLLLSRDAVFFLEWLTLCPVYRNVDAWIYRSLKSSEGDAETRRGWASGAPHGSARLSSVARAGSRDATAEAEASRAWPSSRQSLHRRRNFPQKKSWQ